MNIKQWAEHEIELACKRENPDWDGKSFDYSCSCYASALKAFKSLCKDGHSGMSIGFTKVILNRLIDGKPLSPITDEDFIIDENLPQMTEEDLKERRLKSQVQCPRMSSLFRSEDLNGNVTYDDVNRVVCKDTESGSTFNYGKARTLVNELFPITMPYAAPDKPYMVEMEQFKYDMSPENKNDWDTEAIYSIITPEGEEVKVNKFWKFDRDDRETEITEKEFAERKKSTND